MTDPAPRPENPPETLPGAGLFALGFHTVDPEILMAADAGDSAPAAEAEAGMVVGRYELIEPLGEGGFGVVWRARQNKPIVREVALKLIRSGLDSREVVSRFEAERQALAMMDHPNIAAVLDAGTAAGGRPYFVMELVQGIPITDYCDEKQLSLAGRLALFIPVCQAVQHAHQKAVIHRDLKPSNILVTEIDGRAVPKVIDFGVAKALGAEAGSLAPGQLGRTAIGTVVGTPPFMSPEQAGSGLDVDTRSDLYSLGVILFALLTGHIPQPPAGSDFAGALRWICESETVRPSAFVLSLGEAEAAGPAVRRGLNPGRLARALKGDLDWITLKAMSKDRSRRYETAAALARDLQRHLSQQTVSAAAPSLSYQIGKFGRRHRAGLAAAALITFALVAGTAVSLHQAWKAEQSRVEAEKNYGRARDAVDVFLNRVTDYPLFAEGEFRGLRKGLLETAIPFYEEMSRTQGNDPRLRSDRAWAFGRLGNLQQSVGEFSKAEEAFLQAARLEESLVAEFPEHIDYSRALAQRYNNLSIVMDSMGRREEGLAWQDKALALLRPLMEKYPDSPDCGENAGTLLFNRAQNLGDLNRPAEAEAGFREMEALETRLERRFPDRGIFSRERGSCLVALSRLYTNTNRPADSETALRGAIAIFQSLVDRTPGDGDHRNMLALGWNNLGVVQAGRSAYGDADSSLARALEIQLKLTGDFPNNAQYRGLLATIHASICNSLVNRKRLPEAEAALEKARVVQQQLLEQFPQSPGHRDNLAATSARMGDFARDRRDWARARDAYARAVALQPKPDWRQSLGAVLLEMGDHAAATGQILTLGRDLPPGWEIREKLAGMMVRATVLARQDAGLPEEKKAAVSENYTRHAADLLQQAVAEGYTGVAQFALEEDRKFFRERPEFVELLKVPAQLPPPASPHKFIFEYKGPDPGPRHWAREGDLWTETPPSGKKTEFQILGRTLVGGRAGTQIRHRTTAGGLTLFVPDLGDTGPQKFLRKAPDGSWAFIGNISNLE